MKWLAMIGMIGMILGWVIYVEIVELMLQRYEICYKRRMNMMGSEYVHYNCICRDEQNRKICEANVLKLG